MKILYAIQGTGNGHVSRAREIIPHLERYGEVDLLLSGTQAEVAPGQHIRYRFRGFGFVFGEQGGIDFRKTWQQAGLQEFLRDCRNLPVEDYDLVINDFEPVAAWACRMKHIRSTGLSHQSAYLSPKTPQLKGFHWGKFIMNHYAPATDYVSFHFRKYDDGIHTPVIRTEVRQLKPKDLGYYVIYLPAYSDAFILNLTSIFPSIPFEIFSKPSKTPYTKGKTKIIPIENTAYLKALENCRGLLTGGGFEGPAEALFLKKKLLCVPMKNQYEQQCNALALEEMGVPVIWRETDFLQKLTSWLASDKVVPADFPDETEEIVRHLITRL